MKFSVDYLLAGLAVAVIGGGAATLSAHSSPSTSALETRFSEADYAAFNRGFQVGDDVCEVGFADQSLCFRTSPLESRVVRGERFPDNMYPLALEWRANLAMPRKPETVKTIRIGRTIALMDRDSRVVIDTMRLGETSFATASETTTG